MYLSYLSAFISHYIRYRQCRLTLACFDFEKIIIASVPKGTIVLAAESEEEQVQWMEMLQESGKV